MSIWTQRCSSSGIFGPNDEFVTFLEKHVHLHGRLCGACSQVKEILLDVAQKDEAIFLLSRAYAVMVSETNEGATEA
jgi:hypothetical protein